MKGFIRAAPVRKRSGVSAKDRACGGEHTCGGPYTCGGRHTVTVAARFILILLLSRF